MESRWEALEELEKLVTDQGRLLSSTDNVALLRAGPLEIVRVGRAELREEAWWRYGRELRQRKERYRKLSVAGTVGAAVAIGSSWATGGLSFVGAWLLWENAPGLVTGGARLLRFGRTAWRGSGECARCGRVIHRVAYSNRRDVVLRAEEESVEILVFCPFCGGDEERGFRLRGQEANRTLRKLLAYHHFAGASEKRVDKAARLIEGAGGSARLPSRILRKPTLLDEVGRVGRVALEIAVHEEHEARLLSMEVAELEAHWRRGGGVGADHGWRADSGSPAGCVAAAVASRVATCAPSVMGEADSGNGGTSRNPRITRSPEDSRERPQM